MVISLNTWVLLICLDVVTYLCVSLSLDPPIAPPIIFSVSYSLSFWTPLPRGCWLQSLFFVGFLEVSLKAVYPTYNNVSERMELSEKGGKGGN